MEDVISHVKLLLLYAVFIGTGATFFMDLWALFLKQCFGIASMNYRFIGRWLGHMRCKIFQHKNIMQSAPVYGENVIGWIIHYVIGISFAAGLLLIYGTDWVKSPTMFPALIVGLITVVFPFFVVQPCLGFGIAMSKTPRPYAARIKSIVTHMIFGAGLYFSAFILSQLL